MIAVQRQMPTQSKGTIREWSFNMIVYAMLDLRRRSAPTVMIKTPHLLHEYLLPHCIRLAFRPYSDRQKYGPLCIATTTNKR